MTHSLFLIVYKLYLLHSAILWHLRDGEKGLVDRVEVHNTVLRGHTARVWDCCLSESVSSSFILCNVLNAFVSGLKASYNCLMVEMKEGPWLPFYIKTKHKAGRAMIKHIA